MSLLTRSPTNTTSKAISKEPTGSQSYPNLSDISNIENPSQITFRKRKCPDDDNNFGIELSNFKAEIKEMLCTFTIAQKENIQIISQNIASINTQIADIKSTTDLLISENRLLKSEIAELKSSKNIAEKNITEIKNDLQQLKLASDTNTHNQQDPPANTPSDIINEVQERLTRDKNIIISGLTESSSANINDKREHDRAEVAKIIQKAYPEETAPKVVKMYRLGKVTASKPRLIKVGFESPLVPKTILKNRTQIENVKIYSDQTPYQQKFMKDLKEDLRRRIENGEKDLTIKYINGVPKIIETSPKNLQQ